MPNIQLTPEQIKSIYWIALSVMGLIILLFTVKVILDDSKDEPKEFVKRYTHYILLSWFFIGLWLAPSFFPEYFKGIAKKKRSRPMQTQNYQRPVSTNVPVSNPEENTDETDTLSNENMNEDVISTESNSDDQSKLHSEEQTTSGGEESSEDDSEKQPKKEYDPKVLKRVRSDKS